MRSIARLLPFLLHSLRFLADADSTAFLAENAKKEGVKVLKSGLQYRVLRSGEGGHHPTVDSPCECHYEGTLVDGTKFDSSYDRGSPTTFAPNQVIKGWTEAMQLMVEGDKWELVIPSGLAYGSRGSPPKIPGDSTLVFTIEIINIKGNKVPAIRCNPFTKEGCDDRERVYIDKSTEKYGKDTDKLGSEKLRLEGMRYGKMKPELRDWMVKRISILENLIGGPDADEL
uniref:peptidylprolyl isomerase n=1 Tax=Corethron hystrix TaxID=216773 RepID=A0A6U5D7M2_9STRA|mmetsp:Transcript_10457/g.23109  ORF Transcript_10457/g.23109 Transcript_10457/m.23109 type:complete len:228 (+) Transcript_10457:107-790(+)|eukprot:CAMPEP_0113302428 /NCGR_PEP_ID=MMETSP0010_2-20120614/3243_1 /TAXON_ID=216773 ORGANISM="Corethron hystrix, Strain 308" /NCGR_SAMPLE_ID=MMETSP0010_2 /ASSEMBLY_ACC=CAM_ASM_000155 /LENGTH=227 /DNA_ID=CAMNT_0000156213 /DNA_START=50 /DNA_END=733 /DNA_ORIENTATION=+ /assembly_acc=CAM_ASM_000155